MLTLESVVKEIPSFVGTSNYMYLNFKWTTLI